jgi:acyl-CoA synthetase (AMP-forming)/AMP-acid ligase II
MTESGPTIAQTRLYAPLSDTSVGFVIPGVSYRIEPLSKADSGVGELQVSGPNIMAGYFRAQTLTESVIKEGWLSTGDLAKVSETGTLEIVGRIKELIIRNGFNVYPPEVEAALMSLPEVKQAAVVGDRQAGNESILAFVEIWSDHRFDDEEARKALKEKLAGYKLPDRIQVVDALPAAPSGKILKHRLTINGLDRGVD